MEYLQPKTKVKRITWDFNKGGVSVDGSRPEPAAKRCRSNCIGFGGPQSSSNVDGLFMMPLLPIPKLEDCSSKASIVLTGTARKGGIGPPVGVVDIGVSKSAYYFRIALPGVKKDPGLFSCDVGRDGQVHIRGETSTGGRTVSRYYRDFEMKTQNQCPPGPFTLSFRLPGPVDPRLFEPCFRSDGVFEAVVAKHEQ